ncbi:biotin--[acetyl-CoA-carboxylase] ligase [Maribacter chungangensis]|uniref:Biotin--[acetyl-CoA-carboxylase] ligase n=1 Tax=Maribacter chungangensis TaxID=1069117 RepID=A0ABW3B500_9FLAO
MKIIKLDATESTNSYLRGLMSLKSLEDFTVVTAFAQTKGRGQVSASWESEPGKNLTFSVLRRHEGISLDNHFMISMCVTCAIYDVLLNLGLPQLRIKWPNDILSGTSKICGILIENSIAGQEIKTSIIGIGLNVNQELFPNQVKASSLKLLLGREVDLEDLLQRILLSLQRYLHGMGSATWSSLLYQYESVLFRKNSPATFQEPNGPLFTGIIQGITKEGKLRLALENAIFKEYDLKEIKLHY